jgi:hypothetical protein
VFFAKSVQIVGKKRDELHERCKRAQKSAEEIEKEGDRECAVRKDGGRAEREGCEIDLGLAQEKWGVPVRMGAGLHSPE